MKSGDIHQELILNILGNVHVEQVNFRSIIVIQQCYILDKLLHRLRTWFLPQGQHECNIEFSPHTINIVLIGVTRTLKMLSLRAFQQNLHQQNFLLNVAGCHNIVVNINDES